MPQRFEEGSYITDDQSGASSYDGDQYADDSVEAGLGPSTVIAALDQIGSLVDRARAVPLSANIVLNKAEILDLVEQARDGLPDDLVAADAVVSDAEAVLSRADFAADAAISEANSKARSLLDDARERADSIMSEARSEAERTVARAEEESAHTAARARKEAENLLADARGEVERMVAADAITEVANSRAAELLANSRREAVRLRAGADEYVATTLGATSDLLEELLRRTDGGLRAISERQSGAQTDINIDGR